ncbi:MAG: primosomal protein N', partial [Candidatus Eisenbacteria bacterium]|nr:primosomal protein N' [Candidatus Eisenbacteria bacterium]
MSSTPGIALVALPVALPSPLQYAVPEEWSGRLQPGHRVRVPLRGGEVFGIVTALGRPAGAPPRALRPILAVDPPVVLLESSLLELLAWVARYYAAPLGLVMESAIPHAVARPPRVAGAAEEGEAPPPPAAPVEDPAPPREPTAPQAAALARVRSALEQEQGGIFLLQGVTGSGKTEVYLQAAAAALARGRGALLLVPEIAVGVQLLERVRERFGPRAVEYHSRQRPSERRESWWRAWRGEASIVVGARSAVFVPVRSLGLVVVDEEHEPAYKQGETPRYHGRDTALVRARLAGAVTLLGSATPSLESRTHAERGKYERLVLPERIGGRPAPRVTLADLRAAAPEGTEVEGVPVVGGVRDPGEPLSPYLLERLRAARAAENQAILLLNRRGFSTSVQCRACGHVFECPRCSVVLTHHRAEQAL